MQEASAQKLRPQPQWGLFYDSLKGYEGVYARDGGKHVEFGPSQEGTCFCGVLHNAIYGPVCAFKVYFSEIIIGRKEIDTG